MKQPLRYSTGCAADRPRHFLMDSITAQGKTRTGEKIKTRRTGTHRARHHRCRSDRSLPPTPSSPANHQSQTRSTPSRPAVSCSCSKPPMDSRYVIQAYAPIVDKRSIMPPCQRSRRQAEASLRLALFVDVLDERPRARREVQGDRGPGGLENTYQKLDSTHRGEAKRPF